MESIFENDTRRFGRITEGEFRAEFFGARQGLQRLFQPQLDDEVEIPRQKRFADVKSGKGTLLDDQHAYAGTRETQGGRRAARTAADHENIVRRMGGRGFDSLLAFESPHSLRTSLHYGAK